MRKSILLLLPLAFLGACASAPRIPTDYAGADGGKVVVGIGAAAGTTYSSYALQFRKRGSAGAPAQQGSGRFIYFQTNLFSKQTPDYAANGESGVVLVESLPPGDYEIYNFDVFYNGGTIQKNFGSKTDVSIPFSVKPGTTTYLGNYQANKLIGQNVLGMPLPAGARFIVSDRLASELPIAQAKAKTPLGTPENASPDPERLGNPFFAGPGQALQDR
jgi:hypothetical protein